MDLRKSTAISEAKKNFSCPAVLNEYSFYSPHKLT